MKETLLSVGIDLGTTTTQMILSKLSVNNTASPFSVPHLVISGREVVYESTVYFTPLLTSDTLDAAAISALIRQEYEAAGITPEQVKTGAVIITGETARKENAAQVLRALSDLAGEFVVATAGPALESILAARGAGADRYAREHHTPVLHLDIGGGTANMALFDQNGQLLDTGCLNVGGRLLRYDRDGRVIYRSAVLQGQPGPEAGERATLDNLQPLLKILVQVLEEACGRRKRSALLDRFITDRTVNLSQLQPILSFSGGVADCMADLSGDWMRFGDIGVLLGQMIRKSRLCEDRFVLGEETLRATVIGAGSYSTQLSGSTVFYDQIHFPIHNLPVERICISKVLPRKDLHEMLQRCLRLHEGEPVAFAFFGQEMICYQELIVLAEAICSTLDDAPGPVIACLEQDAAKALGHALRHRLRREKPILCLDGISVPEGSYLDVGEPVGGGAALPVVVKTLVL